MFPTTTSLVVFSSVSVGGGWIFQSAGLLISSASQLSQTPLPAALPLFVTGLGALGLLGWRRKRKQAARSNFVFDVGRIAVKFRRWKAAAICGALALSFSASSGSAATYGFGPGVNYLTFSRPGTAGELVFATGGLFAIYAPSAHFPDDGLGALASSGITLLDSGGQTIYVLSGTAHVCFDQGSFCAFNQLGGFHSLENVVALVVSLQVQTIGDPANIISVGASLSVFLPDDLNVGVNTPLPAALPLFAAGLGALGLLGWRRKRKAQAATA